MKKLALLFLALPFAACATAALAQQTAGNGNCDPRWPGYKTCVGYDAGQTRTNEHKPALSHWDVVTGNGKFLASAGESSAASTGPIRYPGTH
jgi:hypothetical protein